jgi:hypothetical protein
MEAIRPYCDQMLRALTGLKSRKSLAKTYKTEKSPALLHYDLIKRISKDQTTHVI